MVETAGTVAAGAGLMPWYAWALYWAIVVLVGLAIWHKTKPK